MKLKWELKRFDLIKDLLSYQLLVNNFYLDEVRESKHKIKIQASKPRNFFLEKVSYIFAPQKIYYIL